MPEFVINDANYQQVASDTMAAGMCGCLSRKTAYGSLPFAVKSTMQLIPWEEMPDRISDQEKNQNSLEHIFTDSKLRILMQGQLNYCWGFSAAQAIMLEREIMGLPYVELSASSLVAPLVGFQNVGGYIENALKQAVGGGIASTAYVPMTTNDRNQFKDGWRADADKYKVTIFSDIPGAGQQLAAQTQFTYLLNNKPCPNGRNFMSHSMLSIRLLDRYPKKKVNDPTRYGVKDINSWDATWGDHGMCVLEGSHAIADQMYAIEQATFA